MAEKSGDFGEQNNDVLFRLIRVNVVKPGSALRRIQK